MMGRKVSLESSPQQVNRAQEAQTGTTNGSSTRTGIGRQQSQSIDPALVSLPRQQVQSHNNISPIWRDSGKLRISYDEGPSYNMVRDHFGSHENRPSVINMTAGIRSNISAYIHDNASSIIHDNTSSIIRDNTSPIIRGNAWSIIHDNISTDIHDDISAFTLVKSNYQPGPEVRHMTVFSGPGETAFDRTLADTIAINLKTGGRSCETAHYDDAPNAVADCLESMAKCPSERPSLFLACHGELNGHEHTVDLSGEHTATGDLFEQIRKVVDRPVDVFLIACHGGASLKEAHRLPLGSAIAVLAPEACVVNSDDVKSLAQNLKSVHSLDARSLLLAYCSTLQRRYAPSYWKDGQTHALDALMKGCLGRPLPEDYKQVAKEQLTGLVSAERFDEICRKLERARNAFDDISCEDYGPALAIAAAIGLP